MAVVAVGTEEGGAGGNDKVKVCTRLTGGWGIS
jgi:hypothetical protein